MVEHALTDRRVSGTRAHAPTEREPESGMSMKEYEKDQEGEGQNTDRPPAVSAPTRLVSSASTASTSAVNASVRSRATSVSPRYGYSGWAGHIVVLTKRSTGKCAFVGSKMEKDKAACGSRHEA